MCIHAEVCCVRDKSDGASIGKETSNKKRKPSNTKQKHTLKTKQNKTKQNKTKQQKQTTTK